MASLLLIPLVFNIATISCEECPAIYRRLSKQHTYCLPENKDCKLQESVISEDEKKIIVDAHNTLRSKVANGKEKANKQPSASNMMQLVWDDELASIAQKHASQCLFEHDCPECRSVDSYAVGQNLGLRIFSSYETPVPQWESVLQSLYDEVTDFLPKWINPFTAPVQPLTSHYSQMIWASTWRVGCGYAAYIDSLTPIKKYGQLYTCNYGPMGNILNESMYASGKPCSSCPPNTCCDKGCDVYGISSDFPGLCKPIDEQGPLPREPPSEDIFIWCYNWVENDTRCNPEIAEGGSSWETHSLLSGYYWRAILNAGESSTLSFPHDIHVQNSFCIKFSYRKGPDDVQDKSNNIFTGHLSSPGYGEWLSFNINRDSRIWSTYKYSVTFTGTCQFSLTFSVPKRANKQFVDIKSISVTNGRCSKS